MSLVYGDPANGLPHVPARVVVVVLRPITGMISNVLEEISIKPPYTFCPSAVLWPSPSGGLVPLALVVFKSVFPRIEIHVPFVGAPGIPCAGSEPLVTTLASRASLTPLKSLPNRQDDKLP